MAKKIFTRATPKDDIDTNKDALMMPLWIFFRLPKIRTYRKNEVMR